MILTALGGAEVFSLLGADGAGVGALRFRLPLATGSASASLSSASSSSAIERATETERARFGLGGAATTAFLGAGEGGTRVDLRVPAVEALTETERAPIEKRGG